MAYKNPKPIIEDDLPSIDVLSSENAAMLEYDEHNNMFFSFIDILGFKQTFDDNKNNNDKKSVSKYMDIFKYYNHLMNNTRFLEDKNCGAGQTSDSLYFYTDKIDHLIGFIKIYLHFSLYAMSKDVFFRGGIAKGRLFMAKKHQFYGDCVIKAYLLENEIAKFPRISLDKRTYDDLSANKDAKEFILEDKICGRYTVKPFVDVPTNELLQYFSSSIAFKEIDNITTDKIKKYIEKHN